MDDEHNISVSSPSSSVDVFHSTTLDVSFSEMKEDLVTISNPEATQTTDHLVMKCLKTILELRIGASESLSDITNIVNETFPDYSPAAVHNCLVNIYPDLQAQQSNDKEEIYYLGIKILQNQTHEYKLLNWLYNRFRIDEFGSVSFQTLMDIASKELGFVKNTVIGHYVKKAFPTVYTRRSDRLRWYCGISLPEKELTPADRSKKMWLHSASKWLRENVRESEYGKEKCSLVFRALTQFVGKVTMDVCMTAVKCVFPKITRKTYDRNAFYVGISFCRPNIYSEIKHTPNKYRGVVLKKPILNDEEKSVVLWLQTVIQVNELHREKLLDLANLLRKKKKDKSLTEKTCLNYIRKAFPHVCYRKRDGVAQVSGIEIKGIFKPRDPWMEKSISWVREIMTIRSPTHKEKLGPILDVLKPGLQCVNHVKLCQIIRMAFPNCCYEKTLDGKIVYGISMCEDYQNKSVPIFQDTDFVGDFSTVDMNRNSNGGGSSSSTVQYSGSGSTNVNNTLVQSVDFNNAQPEYHSELDNSIMSSSGGENSNEDNNHIARTSGKNTIRTSANDIAITSGNDFVRTSDHNVTSSNTAMTSTGNTKMTSSANNVMNVHADVKKLEQKIDEMATTLARIESNMQKFQEESAISNRQKDNLIVQMQQTLVFLSQQQFQRIVKPTDTLVSTQDTNYLNLQALQTMQTDLNKPFSLS